MESRNNLIVGGIIVILLIVGVVWYMGYRDDADVRYEVPGEEQQVTNEAQNVEFTYYGGPEGYTLLESPENAELGDPQLVKAYTLVDTDRYNENNQSTEGIGQRIPAITIMVFNEATSTEATSTATTTATNGTTTAETESDEPTLEEWAEAHSGFTAYGLRTGEPEEVRVDNISAIHFTSEGPFRSETYIVEHRGKYYVFIGQYENDEDEVRKAFERLMTEVYFL